MQLKSILCPVDFSDFSVAAYRYSLSLAEYYKAKLLALHVAELRKYPFADYGAYEADFANFSRAICEGGQKRLQEFIKKHSAGIIRPEFVVYQGNASDCILSCAQEQNVEIIVMGTHGRRGFDRLVLGSATDRVMRKAPCPVLVVSNPSHNVLATGPDGRHRLSRILLCTDFSSHSESAVAYAISVVREYGAELTMLHVAESAPDPANAEATIAELARELSKLISENECKHLNVRMLVRFGKPYEEIGRHATEMQANLIIMTARGGDAVDRAIFGSTTYRVIQLGPCPVLAIHT